MPIVTYMLELTEEELTVLWGFIQVLQLDKQAGGPKRKFASLSRRMDKVDSAIESVTRKVNELMENPSTASGEGSDNGGAL